MAKKEQKVQELTEEQVAKTYEELFGWEQIVVQVGPRRSIVGNEVVDVEGTRLNLMTKDGYETLERDTKGNTKGLPVKAMGTPIITETEDPRAPGGKKRELSYLPFAVIVDEIDLGEAPEA